MEIEEENCNKKPACDPGWNDPPMFSYDSHTSQLKSEKRGNILNKRVAFPLHSSANSNNNNGLSAIDPTLPPQPCDLSKLPPPPLVGTVITNENACVPENESDVNLTDFNEGEVLLTVMKNFTEVLESKSDNDNIKDKAEDIRRRLDVIKKMWEENKFTSVIQLKILQLSEAIKSGDSEKADHLQKSLMVDYASLCSPWMAGVRHILHTS